MQTVTVNTLRVRARPEDSSRAAFLIEDALRTEISASDRLVLMRKLRLDRRASSSFSHARSNALKSAFSTELANACHATSSSAANANCVWFASKTEAHRILLERLVKGLPVDGWYWHLALPEWQGQSLDDWVGARIENAFKFSKASILKDLIEEFDRNGSVTRLVKILSNQREKIAHFAPDSPASSSQPADKDISNHSEVGGSGQSVGAAKRLLAKLPQSVRRFLKLVATGGSAHDSALELVVKQIAMEHAPALRLDMRELTAISSEIVRMVQANEAQDLNRSEKDVPDTSPPMRDSRDADEPVQDAESVWTEKYRPQEPPAEKRHRREETKSDTFNKPPERVLDPESPLQLGLLKSRAAGLWLIIPAMIHCGWREWLKEKPELLADDPGRFLLWYIAQHHRVADGDHALLPLGDPPEIDDIPEWAYLWRRAVDGWLYRKSKLRLHDLIWRSGKIATEEERVDIHFPIADADMRLRRHALDVDPGWTDWLGLSVRYHFDGEAGS